MNVLRRISPALNLSALVCLLAFNGWLQFHHGHSAADGLFPGKMHYSRALAAPGANKEHGNRFPALTAHNLSLVYPHDCPVCKLFHWSSEPQGQPALSAANGAATGMVPIRDSVRASIPRSACRLRAPPPLGLIPIAC